MQSQPLDAVSNTLPQAQPLAESVPAPSNVNAPVLPYAWMVMGSFALAAMGAMAHRLRGSCDWQVIVLARGCLQLIFAALLAYVAGVSLVFRGPGVLWVRSIAGGLGMLCMFYAYSRLPVAEALTLNNMFPIWVALLSWPLLRQFPSLTVWLAVASAMAGVVLMQQPRLVEGNFASLVALASSVCTAVAMIALNRLRSMDPRAIIVHFSGVVVFMCLVSLLPLLRDGQAAATADSAAPTDGTAFVVVLLLGVGVMALLAQLGITKAFTTGNAAKVSVVNLTQIVFAMMFDVFCFGHLVDWETALGMTLIVVPTAWLMTEPARVEGKGPRAMIASNQVRGDGGNDGADS
jgi:drug/metabolite transporter (DMT)-like permease